MTFSVSIPIHPKILTVDDDPDIGIALTDFLKQEGYAVTMVETLLIRLTHPNAIGRVWSSWKFANPSRCLSFNRCFPAKWRVRPILRQSGGRTDLRAQRAA